MALVLVESLTDPVYVIDRQWRITFVNDSFARHVNRPKSELVGAMLWEILPAEHQARLEGIYGRVMDTGMPEFFVEPSVLYSDRTVDVRAFPVFDGVAVVLRDITRRLNAERALATSEEHLRRALDAADMGDWSWDAETDRMTFSERALALYGLSPAAQGMSRAALRNQLVHPDDVPKVRELADEAYANLIQYEAEYRVRGPEGWRWMRVMSGPHVVDGRVIGAHGLVQDIHQRKLAEERLKAEIEERERAQQRQLLLIHELNHRVKNILAMVQAIAMQTLSTSVTPETARGALEQRLLALAQAHDVLTRESWDGADLCDIIAGAVAPHEAQPGRRFRVQGPPVRLGPKTAVSLALVLHELATNAVKYGSLSVPAGWVSIVWAARPVRGGVELNLTWAEHEGPTVAPPARSGFGARLISRSLASEQGTATLAYPPEGLRCEITLKAPSAAARPQMRLA